MHEPEAYGQLNPFTAIWTRPRETVRYVIEEKQSSFIFLVLVLAGMSGALSGAFDTEQLFPLWGVLIGSLVVGPLGAALAIAILSGIYVLLGKLFGGVGTYSEMFRAVVVSGIPQIWLLPIWFAWLISSPGTFYSAEGEFFSGTGGVVTLFAMLLMFVVGIWSFIIQCKAVGEALRISAWKGLLIIVIPSALVIGAIIAFAAFLLYMII